MGMPPKLSMSIKSKGDEDRVLGKTDEEKNYTYKYLSIINFQPLLAKYLPKKRGYYYCTHGER